MKQIFINLPVKDVAAAMNFYLQLGFTVNPLFTFNDQKCMVWSDQIYVMLQTYELFKSGNQKNLADTQQQVTATFTLPVASLERLHEMIENGLKAGGTAPTALRDEGFMQTSTIQDLDGHHWSIIYLNMEQFKAATGQQ